MKLSPILILDLNNLAHRMAHAHAELEGPNGEATGALYGVLREIVDLLIKYQPSYVIACVDHGAKYRKEIFPGYKNRSHKHDEEAYNDVIIQIDELQRLFQYLPFRTVRVHGEEADDLIGRYAKAKFFKKYPKVIVSGDKDMLQLIDKKTTVLMPRGIITLKNMKENFNCPPDRWLDMRILIGDASDTVPGVPGIGEKYARMIVNKYPSLEEARGSDGEGLPTRVQNLLKKLDEEWEIVERNRLLMDLTVRKLKVEGKDIQVGEWNQKKFMGFCKEHGLKAVLRRLPQLKRVMKGLE